VTPRLLRALPWLMAGTTLVLALGAEARVGGGQSFGGGGGGSSSGGGGGGGGDLLFLILHLIIRYPRVGVPLGIVFVLFLGVRHMIGQRSGHHQFESHAPTLHGRARQHRSTPGLRELRRDDKGFSMPALRDFLVLIHRRGLEAAANGQWDPLAPWFGPRAQAQLQKQNEGVQRIGDVATGGVKLVEVQARGRYHQLVVELDCARVEVRATGDHLVRCKETWVLRRLRTAASLAPEAMQRLGCPSCGVSIETTRMGACPNCDTPISAGQLQWQAVRCDLVRRRPHKAPPTSRMPGGEEAGYRMATVQSPHLAARMREMTARHPDFEPAAFGARVRDIYFALQSAWSAGKWEQARPWVTDPLFQSLRFWIEDYTKHGLRNQLTDVDLHKVNVVHAATDAWYESITVRIHGEMKDSIVDANGTVVGGNAKTARRFSEYWTFIRAIGSGGLVHDAMQCPSCAGPLDNVGQAGVCGYCGSKITSGTFDWVLSSIQQPESYNGET
jgi:hypothetical protein